MRLVQAILTAALAISLTGCVVRGTPKTTAAVPAAPQPTPAPAAPAPPPEPLSIPQTQVQLPPPQPFNPESVPELQVTTPEAATAPAHNNRSRSGSAAPAAPPKPETAPPVAPPPVVVEAPRPPIQEVVPAAEQKRLQDSAHARKRQIIRWLDTRGRKGFNQQQQGIVDRIRAFLKDSDAAEHRGDMREADAIAEHAQILLRELQNGQ
jgi:hypothetical protein